MKRKFVDSSPADPVKEASAPQPAASGSRTTTSLVPDRTTFANGPNIHKSAATSKRNKRSRMALEPAGTSNSRALEVDHSDTVYRPLSPNAPALDLGRTTIEDIHWDSFDNALHTTRPSTHAKDISSLHTFTISSGAEPEIVVCTYAGAASYLQKHQGFRLPLSAPERSEKNWEVKEVVVCGKSLFSTQDIAPGDVIISERPLVIYSTLPNDHKHPALAHQVFRKSEAAGLWGFNCGLEVTVDAYGYFPRIIDRLGPDKRKAFFGLEDSIARVYPGGYITNAEGIVRTNSLPLSLPGLSEEFKSAGVCENISRANHSCVPNARIYFNYLNLSYELRALRPIPANTEITVSYINQHAPRPERQRLLLRYYAFVCGCIACNACSDPTTDQDLESLAEVVSQEALLLNLLEIVPRESPAFHEVLTILRTLYSDHTDLFSSKPIPRCPGHLELGFIVNWAKLEMEFGASRENAMKIATAGRSLIQKMEPFPSSRRYRVLNTLINVGAGWGNVEDARAITEWLH